MFILSKCHSLIPSLPPIFYYKDNLLEGRNNIVSSVCPQVFGLYAVKLSVLLVLIGGVQVGVAECNYGNSYHNRRQEQEVVM